MLSWMFLHSLTAQRTLESMLCQQFQTLHHLPIQRNRRPVRSGRTLYGMTMAEPPLIPTMGRAVWVERKSRICATSAT